MATLLSFVSLISVSKFSGSANNPASPDSNGKSPVMINFLAGKAINHNVISGTVAENQGFIPGSSYLAKVQELPLDLTILKKDGTPVGRRFSYTRILEVESALEIPSLVAALGNTVIEDVSAIPAPATLKASVNEARQVFESATA